MCVCWELWCEVVVSRAAQRGRKEASSSSEARRGDCRTPAEGELLAAAAVAVALPPVVYEAAADEGTSTEARRPRLRRAERAAFQSHSADTDTGPLGSSATVRAWGTPAAGEVGLLVPAAYEVPKRLGR